MTTPSAPMRLVIAGSRDLVLTPERIEEIVQETFGKTVEIGVVLSGGATGMDASGERYARMRKIPVESYPADWTKHGKAAGPIRNADMARLATAGLIVMRKGKDTPGSLSMMKELKKLNKVVKIVRI